MLLDGGAVVADGPPADVLSDDRIRDVFGVDPGFVRRSGAPGPIEGRDRAGAVASEAGRARDTGPR